MREMYALETNNAIIRYDMMGHGPILLCIPGASGINDSYLDLAHKLEDYFTVVLPDRRGYGASELLTALPSSIANTKDTYCLTMDVEDIKTLIQTLSNHPVYLFATDTGAVPALEFACMYPELVKTLLVHEPLNTSVLPNREDYVPQTEQIARTAMIEGVPAAMRQYERLINPSHSDMQVLVENTIAPCAVCSPSTSQIRSSESTNIWLQYELRQYLNYQIDIETLKAKDVSIKFLQGEQSKESLGYEAAKYFAHSLNANLFQVTGGHYGYAQQPKQFAKAVKKILRS
ncbi:alpha/beta fold hydrolase [Staphylococcus simulans]|uniref:alpha/beta fold hydrolase n=1 Tax=Staphylococcus simulans TaxID=1286 RepID=UPI000E67A0F0|nr:alpha/beta hydrolase [Staphylococcus simulans]RIN55103.1 alpha/beta hydrolase [Staphylococcus simulans]UXR35645.1 alpha/beta hydrolase [Staphylococcus simulans]